MKRVLCLMMCMVILFLPATAMADQHSSTADADEETDVRVETGTFDVTDGFEKELDLSTLTKLEWTLVNGDGTYVLQMDLPGKQLPASDWKVFYEQLGWDIAKPNVMELTFSDGSTATLHIDIIGNSGKVRFWIEAEDDDEQTFAVTTLVVEKGIQLDLGIEGYYIIWINGKEFQRIHGKEILIDRYLLKGSNRITVEIVDEKYVSLSKRAIHRVYVEWSGEVSEEVELIKVIQLNMIKKDGKALGRNVEFTFEWISSEPQVEGQWYIWLDRSKEPIVTQNTSYTLKDLAPGTHEVKVQLRTQNGEVIAEEQQIFFVPTENGGILPKTATPWPNMMAAGMFLMAIGLAIWFRTRAR
jgi:hypothetical protein